MKPILHLRLLPLILAAAIVLFLSACGGKKGLPTVRDADGNELTLIVLQTDWFAQPEHGGFYQAVANGYYREVGLEVDIRQGGPNALTGQRVVRNIAQFGIGRSDDVMIQRSRGLPLVVVGAMMQRDPQGILFHASDSIESFADLDGRTIMAAPGSPFIEAIERAYNISINIRPLTYGMEQFLADKRFIQQCFITNEPYYARFHGAEPGVLLIADSGFDPYRVIFTNEDMLTNHRDVVERFVAASLRGWYSYMTGDRTKADAIIAERHDKMQDANFREYSVGAMRRYNLIWGNPEEGQFLGNLNRERIERNMQQLVSIGLLSRPVDIDEVFSFDFIPPADRFPTPQSN
jgi:NitT/TauT family transport system substrate-binding protein